MHFFINFFEKALFFCSRKASCFVSPPLTGAFLGRFWWKFHTNYFIKMRKLDFFLLKIHVLRSFFVEKTCFLAPGRRPVLCYRPSQVHFSADFNENFTQHVFLKYADFIYFFFKIRVLSAFFGEKTRFFRLFFIKMYIWCDLSINYRIRREIQIFTQKNKIFRFTLHFSPQKVFF